MSEVRRRTRGGRTTPYRGYRIEYDPPPIPIRTCDWAWSHDGYDGPGDFRCGHSGSLEQAKADIDEQIADIEADEAPCEWCGVRGGHDLDAHNRGTDE